MEVSSIDESEVDFNLSLEDEFRSIDRLIEQANEFLNDFNTLPATTAIRLDDTHNVTIEDLSSVSDPVININEPIQEIPVPALLRQQSRQVNFGSYRNDDDDVICVDVQNAPVIDYIDLCSPVIAHQTKRKSNVRHYNANASSAVTQEERHERVGEEEPQNKRAKELTCRICFESLFDRATMSTACGHMFCKICMDQVLKIQKKCPSCRQPIGKKNQVFRIHL